MDDRLQVIIQKRKRVHPMGENPLLNNCITIAG